jgi:hypothetical protein
MRANWLTKAEGRHRFRKMDYFKYMGVTEVRVRQHQTRGTAELRIAADEDRSEEFA